MDLELRHLRVVCAVAETGSLTKAATGLGLAQPALSAQLKRIERAVGGVLFERDRLGARPTELGELVLARARVLLPAVKDLQQEVVRFAGSGPDTSRFRLGTTNSPILGGVVDRLAREYPEASIVTHTSWSIGDLADMVMQGRLDYVFAGACGENGPPVDSELSWAVVAVDPVFALVNEAHPLAEKDEVDLADLAGAQWAVSPGEGCFGECFAAACARAGFTPREILEVDMGGCVDLVLLGRAVGLCQATFRSYPGLVTIPLVETPLVWRHMLGWHPEDSPEQIIGEVRAAYNLAAERNPRYADWLVTREGFGLRT